MSNCNKESFDLIQYKVKTRSKLTEGRSHRWRQDPAPYRDPESNPTTQTQPRADVCHHTATLGPNLILNLAASAIVTSNSNSPPHSTIRRKLLIAERHIRCTALRLKHPTQPRLLHPRRKPHKPVPSLALEVSTITP